MGVRPAPEVKFGCSIIGSIGDSGGEASFAVRGVLKLGAPSLAALTRGAYARCGGIHCFVSWTGAVTWAALSS